MLHLGTDAGLEFFGLLSKLAPRRVLLLPALAREHSPVPIHARSLRSFAATLVTGVAEDYLFLTAQQSVPMGDSVDVGSRSYDGVNQTRICVNFDVRLYPEVPLVAFLDLVHLGVTLTGTVLGGTGGGDQGGIDHRTRLEHQALGGQGGVDGAQQLQAKVVFVEQVANPQDGGFVGQSGDASIESCKLTVQRGVMRGLFHGGVRQPTPLLPGKCARSMVATANGGRVRLACEALIHP